MSASLLLATTSVASVSALPAGDAPSSPSLTQQAQYYWNGREFCWYDDGWQGPGWYWCGYAWRRGYGWGGAWGWNNWRFRDEDRFERREFRREWRDNDRDWDHRRDRDHDFDRDVDRGQRGSREMRRRDRDNEGGVEMHLR
jgi:hypothetical protein